MFIATIYVAVALTSGGNYTQTFNNFYSTLYDCQIMSQLEIQKTQANLSQLPWTQSYNINYTCNYISNNGNYY